ncbi:HlyD family efflux transporter periplasmic adaptor subunit [Aliiglaciecola sp. 2_MG-2023]|uniref:HlyD family secretion protein n=1 Tax=unclassified Aliiglaciecola TaxID=2593648 RepID=UPI0026E1367D|nr:MULTISPECIES: HlyD family efflux transporter periplasmic adaptor subunit [unclassified Aliiglaciecola]MDO6710308.1 HlyD family efflux transporter periplasmic adaptor subunit [Aliiglaciecola sp. 2_MG-2023]MDO6751456.1 HlyD family efflux transporter periplasmic adaptor subunit [Aliiglaciecola sp. 1_MG-2023]
MHTLQLPLITVANKKSLLNSILVTTLLLFSIFLGGCQDHKTGLALGTLERNRIAHTATVNEVVTRLPIAQGTLVKKGDVLVQLDDRQQRASVAKAEASVAEAQANLDKLRNGARPEEVASASAKLEGAQAALTESESAYLRAKNLISQKLVSQANVDQARATRDANVAAVHEAEEALLLLTNGTRPEDLEMGKANLAIMQAALASEIKKLEDLTIVATRDGRLDNLPWNLGERVTMGSPVAIVLAGEAPYARIYVPEPYRVKIKAGDTLPIHVDGLSETINGTVRWISIEAAFTPYYALNQEERARLMYLAEVQLPVEYADLPNGIAVQVELP